MTNDEIVMRFSEEVWRGRRTLSLAIRVLCWAAALLAVVPPTAFLLLGRFTDLLGDTNPFSYYGAVAVIVLVLAFVERDHRRRANSPPAFAAITTKGLWIPHRPSRASPRTEEFLPYCAIAEMTPIEPKIAARLGFQHAYMFTMTDGAVVPLSAVSLAGLATDAQIRAYAIALNAIRDWVSSAHGSDGISDPRGSEIPRVRFADALRALGGDGS